MNKEERKAQMGEQVNRLVALLGEQLDQLRRQQNVNVHDLCRSMYISEHTLSAV